MNVSEGNMVYLSIMAIAVGRFIRFLAVRIVRRLLPSLLIDSIWGEGSMKEAANDSSWIFHWIAGGFQSFWKLTITAVVENSNFGCCTKSLISKFVPETFEFTNSTKLLFLPRSMFPATESSKSIYIYSEYIPHIRTFIWIFWPSREMFWPCANSEFILGEQ